MLIYSTKAVTKVILRIQNPTQRPTEIIAVLTCFQNSWNHPLVAVDNNSIQTIAKPSKMSTKRSRHLYKPGAKVAACRASIQYQCSGHHSSGQNVTIHTRAKHRRDQIQNRHNAGHRSQREQTRSQLSTISH